jgi:hypothetical protein
MDGGRKFVFVEHLCMLDAWLSSQRCCLIYTLQRKAVDIITNQTDLGSISKVNKSSMYPMGCCQKIRRRVFKKKKKNQETKNGVPDA